MLLAHSGEESKQWGFFFWTQKKTVRMISRRLCKGKRLFFVQKKLTSTSQKTPRGGTQRGCCRIGNAKMPTNLVERGVKQQMLEKLKGKRGIDWYFDRFCVVSFQSVVILLYISFAARIRKSSRLPNKTRQQLLLLHTPATWSYITDLFVHCRISD
jgi:hypothetical protein